MLRFLLRFIKTEDLENEYLKRYADDIHADDVDEEVKDKIFAEIGNIEGIQIFLKSILKRDRIRFFNSPVEGQPVIKGAFLRVLWMLKSVRKKDKVEYTNPRYK